MNGPDTYPAVAKRVRAIETAWRTAVSDNDGIRQLVVSNSGSIAVIAGQGRVRVLENGSTKHELVGQAGGIATAVACAKELVAGGADGFIKWWRLESGEEIASTQFPNAGEPREVTAVVASPSHPSSSSSHLLAAASGRLIAIFGSGGEHLHTLPGMGTDVTAMAWLSPSVLAAVDGTSLHTWFITQDMVSKGWHLNMDAHGPVTALATSPNGAYLAASSQHSVLVWDVAGRSMSDPPGKPVFEYRKEGSQSISVSWDATSHYLAAAFGNQVLVWNIAVPDGPVAEVVCVGHEPSARITSIAFQPTGSLLGVIADNGGVLVYDSQQFSLSRPGQEGHAETLQIKHLAAAHLAPARPCKGFLAWHSRDTVIAAYESGEVACLEVVPDATYDEATTSNGSLRGRGEMHASRGGYDSARGRGRGRGGFVPSMPPEMHLQRSMADSELGPGSRVIRAPPKVAAGPMGMGFRGRGSQPVRVAVPPVPPSQLPRPQVKAKPDGPPGSERPEGGPSGWWAGPEGATNMQWPGVQPMPYVMFAPPQPMPNMPGAVPGFSQPAPPPGSFKPVAGMPPGSNISTSVWSPSTGMAMPSAAQMPVYMYPGQWPMTYMQQWPGYYPYYGFQPGMPAGMQAVMSMPMPAKAGMSADGSSVGTSSGGQRPPTLSERAASMTLSEGGSWPVASSRPRPAVKQRQPSMRQSSGELPSGVHGGPAPGGFVPMRADSDSLDMPESAAGAASSGGSSSYSSRIPGHMHSYGQQHPALHMQHPHVLHPGQMGQGGQVQHVNPQQHPRPHTQHPHQQAFPQHPYPQPHPGRGGGGLTRMRGPFPMDANGAFDEGSLNVYVGNLAAAVDEGALFASFNQFGIISSTQVIRDKETGESRGFGFVTYNHPMSAMAAMQHMNGVTLGGPFGGQSIKVSPSRKNT